MRKIYFKPLLFVSFLLLIFWACQPDEIDEEFCTRKENCIDFEIFNKKFEWTDFTIKNSFGESRAIGRSYYPCASCLNFSINDANDSFFIDYRFYYKIDTFLRETETRDSGRIFVTKTHGDPGGCSGYYHRGNIDFLPAGKPPVKGSYAKYCNDTFPLSVVYSSNGDTLAISFKVSEK